MTDNIVTINGKRYDAHTGVLLDSPQQAVSGPSTTHASVHSGSIHHSIQKSRTLRRKSLLAPHPQGTKVHVTVTSKARQKPQQSPAISRFAPHPVTGDTAHSPAVSSPDIPAQSHALLQRVENQRAQTQPQEVSSKVVKDQAIEKALARAKDADQPKSGRRLPRIASFASGSLALLLLAGYVTYINMPSISVRVAAVQSGIDASYPGYQPSGYSLAGPVEYSEGRVSMRFAANAGPQNYTIVEEKTNWDSSAVAENHVDPISGGQYVAHRQGGLTIYTYDGGAAWVNGGILYTIKGDAPLSNEQILRLAGSL